MKLLSTRTEMFRARVRLQIKHKIRKLLPHGCDTGFLREMKRPELDNLFRALQYGKGAKHE